MIKDPVVKGIDRRREGKGIWGGEETVNL